MMIWKDKELKTLGDISEAMLAIHETNNEAEAAEFMRLMLVENEHARDNVGYLTGYFSAEQAAEMRRLFLVTHPIFGNTQPTAEEAFLAGAAIGKSMKRAREE